MTRSGDYAQLLKALCIALHFAADVDPIAPLADPTGGIPSPWPLLRLMLRQIWEPKRREFVTQYAPFKDLKLVATHCGVDVSGLSTLTIRNDETELDSKKPFEPFGAFPAAGSRFFVGHPELIHKRLDKLTFHLQWMGLPGEKGVPRSLSEHYEGYGLGLDKKSFTANISLVDRRVERLLEQKPLFASLQKPDQTHAVEIPNMQRAVDAKAQGYLYDRSLEAPLGEDLLNWHRYIQWQLNSPDFQHFTYPAIAAQKSIAMAADIASKKPAVKAKDYTVNPPYTPKLQTLRLDYGSSVEVVMSEYRHGPETDQISHLQPFGYNEVQEDPATQEYAFLPQYENEGELYIGIRDLHPPQNLSVLFQMAEGSADANLDQVPLQWSYLSEDRWISLDQGSILSDTTRGFINSGIVEFDLPANRPSTLLGSDLYWIRASISRNADSVCDAVAIHSQAVSATFTDHDNAPDHYAQPLPPGSITGLSDRLAEITAVHQPYTSFGGKMEEQSAIFYTRVSERLRHKQRALTIWDYEHLVLDHFPQIYKAKCLPTNLEEHPDDPGRVEIVVIPDIRNQLPFDPFEPRAPADLIADIESFLADKTPAAARVSVRNAHYVPVRVRVGVRFKPGGNEGFYKQLLLDELNHFLSPWAYEEGADIVIGGRIYANSIINFIDRRDYVDYVAEIRLFSSEDGRTFRLARPSQEEGYFVTTDRPDGVLVAARDHEIDVISEVGYEEESFIGIDYMKVELDLVVD